MFIENHVKMNKKMNKKKKLINNIYKLYCIQSID